MRSLLTTTLLASAGALLSGCAERSITGRADRQSLSAERSLGLGDREVTIDFTSVGEGIFAADFYRLDGILFPAEACGSSGCAPWLVVFTQGDDALVGEPRLGPVKATFQRPISDLSLSVAPRLQGTATYTLNAFTASGELIGTTSLTVTQDEGDPANTGFGYFTIKLANLPAPAKTLTLANVFVRSSFPENAEISYGVSSISYTHWR